jgi:multicomponent Na+:H+ antiporter subunit A
MTTDAVSAPDRAATPAAAVPGQHAASPPEGAPSGSERAWLGWVLAGAAVLLAAWLGVLAGPVAAGEAPALAYSWAPSLGVNLALRLDGLGLLFAFLITGIGALVFAYAAQYLRRKPHLGRFFLILAGFTLAMLGLVLADNLLLLFVFWELTSLTSYLLIGTEHRRAEARHAALQALLVTGGGGLLLLGGLVLLGQAAGSMELSVVLQRGDAIRADPFYLPILLLVALGAFTKSAQVPFHFWLPNAMEAPTPVSAYLHSATMVKAGVYLLARLHPVLGGTDAWLVLIGGVGGLTMLTGGLLALVQVDLKRILAYSTVSALGMLVLLLGIGTEGAIAAAVVFLLAHALYKGALFMIAGAIDHETGTRDIRRLGGLRRAMPLTAAAAILAAISLAGIGPVLSFIAKELLLEAALAADATSVVVVPAAVLSGALFVAVALIVGIGPLFGAPKPTPKPPHEAPLAMWLGPALLAVLGAVFGLLPALVAGGVVAPAATAVFGGPVAVKLELWHGLNLALALSGISALLGLGGYWVWRRVLLGRPNFGQPVLASLGPSRGYELAIVGLNTAARVQTRLLQHGYLRYYLLTTVVTTVVLVGVALIGRGALPSEGSLPSFDDVRLYDVALAGLIVAAAIAAVVSPSRLGAVAALGVVGYGMSLVFVLFGAPDLAMTQILIETLTVILFVLVVYHLPRFSPEASDRSRLRDALVSMVAGSLMTLLILAAFGARPESKISGYFAERSVADAHGRNVVNVILVDFRALDRISEFMDPPPAPCLPCLAHRPDAA